jgi:hypothetical protein
MNVVGHDLYRVELPALLAAQSHQVAFEASANILSQECLASVLGHEDEMVRALAAAVGVALQVQGTTHLSAALAP